MDEFYTYIYLDPRKPVKFELSTINVCLLFEPFYVGKGKGLRIYAHLNTKVSKNKLKIDKIRRIQNSGYTPILLKVAENLLEESALLLEELLIAEIGTKWVISGIKRGPLTNQTSGGEGRILSEECKRKLSELNKGKNNPMFGRRRTESEKQRLRELRKMFRHSDDTKLKMSEKRSNGKSGNHKAWTIICPNGESIRTTYLKGWCSTNGHSYNTIFNTLKRRRPVKSGPSAGFMLTEDELA